ncbi:MAG: DNA polymerase III subunit alpha, partial [Syntrophobacterales bacterium]
MKPEPFVHLHLHTGYSMLDGACRVAKVMDFAAQENMPAVAITDHGVMFGTIDFYKAAVKNGIKPIIGCEVYVARGSHKERKTEEAKAGSYHLVLLAADATGYMNLARLVSTAHIDGFYYKPRIDKELLAKHSKGLIGLSACLKGEVPGALSRHDMPSALKAGCEYEDILGKGNFFVEVQNHELKEQKDANSHMHEFTKKSGIPLVATNDVHYIQKAHAAAHDVLLCIQTQAKFSDPDRMRYHTNEFYMKTRKEMEEAVKEFPDSINRTLEIAERCNVTMRFDERHFPTFSVPKGMSEKEYLVKNAHEGITKRYGIANPDKPANARERDIMKRFDYEISVIDGTNFINYFLVVWDFVRFALENNIPVGPGRGSGGGSLSAYVLGITNIDPLRYNLVFERFLNPSRVSPPDFDIDFCQARRGEVIEYVRSKYKPENVAQIVTFGSLGSKTVIRDIGRVLEIDFATCDRLSKLVPDDPKITLAKALEESPEFKKASENDPACRRILTYAMVLEGLPRNTGTHAAGVVIGEKPLIQIVPLSLDKDGQIITQYPKDPLGDIGLLKMDFLGLKTLTVVDEAIKLIQKTSGVRIELDRLPYDDKPTHDLFNRGDTVGVFQLESSGMRDLIRRIGINKIEDLIAMIALYRPGPMRMLQDYVNRKSGKATVTYDHPLLEPILKETYGVMVYQEQVQMAANILAGYSLGEADLLRRAMSKKDKDKMEEERASFVEGCGKTNKIAPKLAAKIFDNIQQFAGYGFNKAHSAGYAIISYQTAYLKANYPAEFMSALLSSEMGNSEKLPVFIAECLEMDLKILPPDVSRSDVRFTPEAKDAIRFGLAGIKNVGEGVSAAMVSERRKNGPFKSLFDICTRLGGQQVNKKVFESLIDCGALD